MSNFSNKHIWRVTFRRVYSRPLDSLTRVYTDYPSYYVSASNEEDAGKTALTYIDRVGIRLGLTIEITTIELLEVRLWEATSSIGFDDCIQDWNYL